MARLGDVCEKRIDTIGTSYKGDITYIDISSIDSQRKEISHIQKMSFSDAPSRAKQLVRRGDILVSTVRPNLNAVALIDNNFENTVVASTGYCVLRCLPIVDRRYVFHYCQSPAFVNNLVVQATGASYPAVTATIVKESEIPLPSLSEQRRIAALLDKVSDLIAKRRQQMDKLDELVKARFVEMFGDIVETVPISYYIKDLSAGKSLAGEAECVNKVLKTGAATYDYFDSTQVKNLPLDYKPLEAHRVKRGDVIISRMNTAELVGAAAYVWDVADRIYLPDRLWKSEFREDANPIFVWQMLIQNSVKDSIRHTASGTSGSMKNISKSGLLGIKVKRVNFEMQNQFASFVTQTDKSKLTIQKSLEKLETLKKALMQEYF